MRSELNDQRMAAVLAALCYSGARSVADLGCGPGDLLLRLAAEPRFERILGLDLSAAALAQARQRLQEEGGEGVARITLLQGSFLEPDPRLAGFEAAALVETIEHVEPERLSALERAVFARARPGTVVVTTPNQEYNLLYDMGRRRFRNPDHRFEWPRQRFRDWAEGVAARNGYRVGFAGIGPAHPRLGCATQMAVFTAAVAAAPRP